MMNRALLTSFINNIDLTLTDLQTDQFLLYESLLVEWNKHMNLTGIVKSSEIYDKHFSDSLTSILSGKIHKDSKIIDVGTGAGFPGMPIKIYQPEVRLTLLDSLNKRINFLKHVAEELKLQDIEFLHGRAEDFGKDQTYRGQYDVVVSRAVAELPVLLEFCLPFLKVGGYFVSHKGKKCHEEIEKAENALKVLNAEVESVEKINSSKQVDEHYILVIKKTGETPEKYPRKAGKPIKKPL